MKKDHNPYGNPYQRDFSKNFYGSKSMDPKKTQLEFDLKKKNIHLSLIKIPILNHTHTINPNC